MVPLHAQDSSVRAYALIDASDAEWVGQWRWSWKVGGYAVRSAKSCNGRSSVYLHREVLGLPRVSDGREGDHIDRNPLNNRKGNLRVVVKREQQQNVSPMQGATSAYRGVSWSREMGRWHAYITVRGQRATLGYFADEDDAAAAAREARARLMPYAVD